MGVLVGDAENPHWRFGTWPPEAGRLLCRRKYGLQRLAEKYSEDNQVVTLPRVCNRVAGHEGQCCDHRSCSCDLELEEAASG